MRLFLSYYNHGLKQEAKLKRKNIQNSVKNITRIQENSKKKKEKEERQCIRRRVKARSTNYKIQTSPTIDLPKEASKKRRMADSEQNLPKGKKGWSHHLFKRISWKKKQKEAIQVLATPKATEGTTFKELAPKNFVRDLRA